MKLNFSFRNSQVILILIASIWVSGCENCEPDIEELPPLTKIEKSIIPVDKDDSLFFRDETGKTFFLHCTSNKLVKDGHLDTGHANPCEDNTTVWDKQIANFTGNLILDNDTVSEISTSIAVSANEREFREVNCGDYTLDKRFIIKINEQYFFGNAPENIIPAISEFTFKPEIKLDGELFQDINFKTNSTCVKDHGLGLDSIYYSTKLGLIRLTTIGGKKYQRVL